MPWPLVAAGVAAGLGSVVGGLINAGRKQPAIDLTPLFGEIGKAGAEKADLINRLPTELRPLYEEWKKNLAASGEQLQASRADIGKNLMEQTQELYGPESPAVKATLDALRMQNYSTLPGTMTNLKAQLASTGGLARGGASKAITQAVLQPAQQYGQQAANVMAEQLQTQQQNVQAAINKIAALDDDTAVKLFGMTTAEAQDILTYGRSDLQDQLAGLINNIDTMSNQKLSLLGAKAQNELDRANARVAQQSALTNALTSFGSSMLGNAMSNTGGASAGGGLKFPMTSPTTSTQYQNVSTSGTSFPGNLSL
jgi:hypothetical protein